ncbi:hypothetical protein RND71_012566 [Anisodus tanguticus]|uniref:Uncharacterized protein n=2 Tax=Anisodus tanguticus TaxID=243964 RepID=A0AAE1SDI8_9SOLA|nr:hypothetical protein RND71_012566 [Anisodus tanguticus]
MSSSAIEPESSDLVCQLDNVQGIVDALTSVRWKKQQDAVLELSEHGIVLIVEETACLQAKVYLQRELFVRYEYSAEGRPRFGVSLGLFVDCLNTFSVQGHSSAIEIRYPGPDMQLLLKSVDSSDSCTYAEIRTRIPDTISWDYNFEPAGSTPLSFTVKALNASHPGHLQKQSTNPRVVHRSSGFLSIFSLKFVQKGGKGKERYKSSSEVKFKSMVKFWLAGLQVPRESVNNLSEVSLLHVFISVKCREFTYEMCSEVEFKSMVKLWLAGLQVPRKSLNNLSEVSLLHVFTSVKCRELIYEMCSSSFIVSQSALKEAIDDLEWPGSSIHLILQPTPPSVTFRGEGHGDLQIDFMYHVNTDLLAAFHCDRQVSHRYKYKFLRATTSNIPSSVIRDNRGSKLTIGRGGMLKVQHLVSVAKLAMPHPHVDSAGYQQPSRIAYIEFFVKPEVDEDDANDT